MRTRRASGWPRPAPSPRAPSQDSPFERARKGLFDGGHLVLADVPGPGAARGGGPARPRSPPGCAAPAPTSAPRTVRELHERARGRGAVAGRVRGGPAARRSAGDRPDPGGAAGRVIIRPALPTGDSDPTCRHCPSRRARPSREGDAVLTEWLLCAPGSC